MTLDEPTATLLQAMAASGAKPLHELTPVEARALMAAAAAEPGRGPQMAEVSDHDIAVDGGTIPVRRYCPADPIASIVYFHGGGWVLGTVDEFDLLARTLAERTRSIVYSVGYRLAPEHRFPVATDDAFAALRWVAGFAESGQSLPLLVAGDSAGGTLAAVVARRARDEAGPAIAGQVLIYPATDCDLDTESYLDPANQLTLSRDAMVWFWDNYADAADRLHPDASPLQAAELSGLPSAVVITAEHDPLRDEGEAYADAMSAAGVPVQLRRFDGQVHGFVSMLALLPGASVALDHIAAQVHELLGVPAASA